MAVLQTPVCDFGAPAPDFNLMTPGGQRHSRDSVMSDAGLLVVFMCNHCPYVVGVIDRLVADIKEVQAMGFGVACIMSNDYREYPSDAPDKMATFAAQYGLTAPYLVDEDQSVGKAYGAVCTPDFFGYNADGVLQYRGRLDNAGARSDATNRIPDLINAMQLIKDTGTGPTEQKPSMGCSIKWT